MLEQYYRELLHYFSRITGARDTAADIVQETYLRVLGAQQSGSVISQPRALLYRTGKNILIDQHRRKQIRDSVHDGALEEDAILPATESLHADHTTEPEVQAVSTRNVERMLTVIDALPPRCREAFILHKFDGHSHAQVAERMGISKKMVEQHIKLAMQACRRCKESQESHAMPDAGLASQRDKT